MKNSYAFTIEGNDKTKAAFKSIQSNLKITQSDLVKLTAATAGFASIATAIGISSAKTAKELDTMAQVAGVGVEEFQALSYAFNTFNISQEKFADVSKDVQDKLGDFLATGAGPFKDFFEQVAPKVGLTAEALRDLSSTDVLIAVKRAMDDANVSAKEQVFYMEAIASDATALIPALEDNGKALRELTSDYNKLNIAMSQTEVDKLKDLSNDFQRLNTTFDSITGKVTASLIEPLSGLADLVDTKIQPVLLKTELGFTGMAMGILRAGQAMTKFNSIAPPTALIGYLADIDFATISENMGGAADALDVEIDQIQQTLRELNNPNFGETNNILEGTGLFDIEGAVSNIDLSPIAEAGGNAKNIFLETLRISDETLSEMINFDSLQENMDVQFWQDFAESGFTAFDTLDERSNSFWENMQLHVEATSEDFDAMWGNTFDRFAQGIGEATTAALLEQQSFGDAMKSVAKGALQSVIQGLVELGVKQLALFAIENTILASGTKARTTAVTTEAGIAASAWATPAALASLATGGANAAPAQFGIGTTVAFSQGLAGIQSFDGGGYTWDGPRSGGLDGKGGRLAMLHSQEVVTDLTKSQPSGGMTVSQTINISGNADRSVIEELRKENKRFARMVNSVVGVPM